MFGVDVKMALYAIRSAKWRSLLTVVGIVIGVVSVVTSVGLGEGIKRQIAGEIDKFGSDLIMVRPGKIINRDGNGKISGVNFMTALGASTLNDGDLIAINGIPEIKNAVPVGLIGGLAQTDDRTYEGGIIIATSEKMPEMLNQKIEYGEFFSEFESNRSLAVIGKNVATQLFQENVPIGKSISIRGQSFIVRGIFEEFETDPLTPNDFNSAIFIPYNKGKEIASGSAQLSQILIKPTESSKVQATVDKVHEAILKNHGGQEDFTVMKQEDTLAVADSILNLLTAFVAGIAAISLFVGGIGVMNIMLVSVTERTREIGIRKSIGATNSQILNQFLVEAIALGMTGGIIGIIVSFLVSILIRIASDLKPVITLSTIAMAVGVSLLVGAIFGIAPAIKASRKDPIEALRYE